MIVILLDRNALPVKLLFSMINKVPFFYTLPAKINDTGCYTVQLMGVVWVSSGVAVENGGRLLG